jgi:hypothetical protein
LLVDTLPNNELALAMTLYVFPARRGVDRKVSEPGVETAAVPEIFKGSIYRFGDCFYGLMSIAKGKDERIRYFLFPKVNMDRLVHYGLMCGYGTNLEEPVALRAVAEKISNEPVWEKDDVKMIRRYEDSSHSDIRDCVPLIDNQISEGFSVLTVSKNSRSLETITNRAEANVPPPE